MGGNSNTKAVTDKKQKILDTALLLFAEGGFHTTSTASIAKKSGVATGTLFHHFPSKDALLAELLTTVKEEFSASVLSGARAGFIAAGLDEESTSGDETKKLEEKARTIWFAGLDWAVKNPVKLQLFLAFSQLSQIEDLLGPSKVKVLLGFMYELVEEGQAHAGFRACSQELLAHWSHSQFLSSASYLISHPGLDKEKVQQDTFELFWNGIRA